MSGPADRAEATIVPLDGHWQIVVDGRDVTFFRGAPIALPSYSSVDPFGYEAATLAFPQIGVDELGDLDLTGGGEGDLHWLRFGARVLIRRVGGAAAGVVFSGRLARVEVTDEAISAECVGGLVAALSWIVNPVLVVRHDDRDCTDWILSVADYPANQLHISGPQTGIVYRQRGSRDMTGLGFVTEVLAEAQTVGGVAWTVLPAPHLGSVEYRIQERDYTTVNAVVTRGAPGVSTSLADDIIDHPNRFYGAGVRPDGGRWNNLVAPNLGPKLTPPFPGNLDVGDSGSDVVALTRELVGNGLLENPSDVYTDRVGEAVRDVRDAALMPAGTDVSETVWDVIFAGDIYSQSYRQSHYAPLVMDPATAALARLPDGTVMGTNPDFDPSIARVEQFVNYGSDVEKIRARRNARREYQRARGSGLAGTITLTTDPLDDEGDPFHRTLIRAGQNIRLAGRSGTGGPVLHIARVDTTFDDNGTATVTLAVDQQGRDYLTLAAAIERNTLAKQNPAKQWRHSLLRRSVGVPDTITGWDFESGAGIFHDVELEGDRWTVFPVIGAQAGSIARVRVELRDSACPFAMAIFARDVDRSQLNRWAPDPLADRADDGSWVADNDTELNEHDPDAAQITRTQAARGLLVYAAGTPNTLSYETLPCGYYPAENANGAVTGNWQDDGSWAFYTRPFKDNARLYVAIYPTEDCTADGRLFYIVEDA